MLLYISTQVSISPWLSSNIISLKLHMSLYLPFSIWLLIFLLHQISFCPPRSYHCSTHIQYYLSTFYSTSFSTYLNNVYGFLSQFLLPVFFYYYYLSIGLAPSSSPPTTFDLHHISYSFHLLFLLHPFDLGFLITW